MTRVLTGIQSSGNLHWGNYFGAIKPMIAAQEQGNEMFFMIADLHAFTTVRDPEIYKQNQKNVLLDYLALGIDPDKSVFFRQSDVAAHTELAWYLNCLCPMGLLERAHSYKDKKAKGLEANAGLFTYPMLIAADILLYDAQQVPVGKDQKQHVEMARDIAQKFNHQFGEIFTLPEAVISENLQTIPGLDGQKMSKSYGNTIAIFEEEKTLKKKINSIKTASLEMGEPIDPETCPIMAFHKLFATPNLETLTQQYRSGSIGFGQSKKILLETVWDFFQEARTRREQLEKNLDDVEEIMTRGAARANQIASKKLQEIRTAIGIR